VSSQLHFEAGRSNFGGRSDKDAYNSHVPLYGRRLQGSQYDWNYTTTPQAALYDRAIPYPRGFIIGGSSSISAYYRDVNSPYANGVSRQI
jgi:choline dehydrogenase